MTKKERIIEAFVELLETLDEVTGAEPEKEASPRPTGTWHQSFWKMPTAREIRLFYYYECDFCKNEVMVEHIDGYNYCPHCGADMRGEEND